MAAIARWVDPVNGDSANAGLSRDDAYADMGDVTSEDPGTASDDLTIHLVGNNADTPEDTPPRIGSGLTASTVTLQVEDGPYYMEKMSGYTNCLALDSCTVTGNRATGETGPRCLIVSTHTGGNVPRVVDCDPGSGNTVKVEASAGIIARNGNPGASNQATFFIDGPGTVYLANCIAMGWNGAEQKARGFYTIWGSGNPNAILHNCGSYDSPDYGFVETSGSMACKNCVAFDSTTADYSSLSTADKENCASGDDTGDPNDSGIRNLTVADELAGGSGTLDHWYEANLKSASNLIGEGTDLDSDANLPVSVDIMGQPRDASTPDIGPFEYNTVPKFVDGGELLNATSATLGSNSVALRLPAGVENAFLVVDAVYENDSTTTSQRLTSVQYNSVSLTEGPSARNGVQSTTGETAQIFYLDSPTLGASHNVTWTNAAGGQDMLVRWRLYAHCTTVGEYTSQAGSAGDSAGNWSAENHATTETDNALIVWVRVCDRGNVWWTAQANNNPRGHSATVARTSTGGQASMNGDRFVASAGTEIWGCYPDAAESAASVAIVLSGDFTPTTNIRRRGHGCFVCAPTSGYNDWAAVSMQSDVDCIVILAGYERDDAPQDITALSIDGDAMTEQYEYDGGGTGGGVPKLNVYTLLNPSTGVQDVAITDADDGRDIGLWYYTYSGVDSIGSNTDSDRTTGTTACSATISHDADSMILGLGVMDSPTGAGEVNNVTGTLVDFQGAVGNGGGVGIVYIEDFKASSGSATAAYGLTQSRDKLIVMLELKAAGGATTHEAALTLAKDVTLTYDPELTYEAAITYAKTAGLAFVSEKQFDAAVAFAKTKGLTLGCNLSLEAALAIAKTISLTPTADVEAGGSLTLSATKGIDYSVNAELEADLPLNTTTGLTFNTDAVLETTLALAKTMGITQTATLDYNVAVDLAKTMSILYTGEVSLEGDLSLSKTVGLTFDATSQLLATFLLAKTAGITYSTEAVLQATVELAKTVGVTYQGTTDSDIEAALTLAKSMSLSYDGVTDLQATLALDKTASLGMVATAILEAGVAMNMSAGLNFAGGKVLAAALLFSKTTGTSFTSEITLEGVLDLNANTSITTAVQASLEAGLDLDKSITLAFVANAILQAGLSLSVIKSLTFSGTIAVADFVLTPTASVTLSIDFSRVKIKAGHRVVTLDQVERIIKLSEDD